MMSGVPMKAFWTGDGTVRSLPALPRYSDKRLYIGTASSLFNDI